MEWLSNLYESWKKIALRSPHLKLYHIVLALWYYHHRGTLGRYTLMELTGLTEATTKTLINFLKKNGILESIPRKGHFLTQKGRIISKEISTALNIVENVEDLDTLVVCPEKSIVLVRNASKLVSDGLKERDSAILAGACGATTLIVTNGGSISLPNSEAISDKYQRVLHKLLKLQPSDVIIIGSAKNKKTALLGALSAAVALLL